MSTAVHVIWWISLAIALGVTLVAVGYLLAVIRTCGHILELAQKTIPSALVIAGNTSAIKNLTAVIGLAPTLLSVAGSIDKSSEVLASTVESVAPAVQP